MKIYRRSCTEQWTNGKEPKNALKQNTIHLKMVCLVTERKHTHILWITMWETAGGHHLFPFARFLTSECISIIGDHFLVCQHTFIYGKKVSKKSFLIIPIIYKWQQCRKARYFIPKIPYTWMKKTSDTLIPKTSGRAWWNVFQALQTLPKTLLRPFINTLQAFYKRLWKI